MTKLRSQKVNKNSGFSLVEMLIVVVIIMILLAAAIIQIPPMLKNAHADAAASYVLNEIRVARERAVDERRVMRITFSTPRSILMEFGFNDPVSGTLTFAPVTLSTGQTGAGIIQLPSDVQFVIPPVAPLTAPDGTGNQGNAFDFYCAGAACAGVQLYFYPDGSIQNATQDPVQGVVYMARPGDSLSGRAVSFMGPTGRAKAWRIRPVTSSTTKWVQQ